MKSVLYEFKSHKKINGTLFYCFEYFSFLRRLDSKVRFVIYKISERDFQKVLEIFRERYFAREEDLSLIQRAESVRDLHGLGTSKNLVLDLKTFESVYMFLKGDILCYANEPHKNVRSQHKKITYYGFYDYQNRDVDALLKFYFDIFKPVKNAAAKVLMSSLAFNFNAKQIPQNLKDKEFIKKTPSDHRTNFFAQFQTLYYIHTALDTNNRLIPECFFYNKDIYIEYTGLPKDSVYFRYEDIKENGLDRYTLREDDRLVRDFLEAS